MRQAQRPDRALTTAVATAPAVEVRSTDGPRRTTVAGSKPQHGIHAGPVHVEVAGPQLRSVHADQHGGSVVVLAEQVGEDVLEPLVQGVPPLVAHDGVLRQPPGPGAVPRDDHSPGSSLPYRVEGVADRCRGQRGSLVGSERGRQPRLDPARDR